MNRTPISGNVPAELAERQSDQSVDVTDADESEAITAIVEDYLLLGFSWPSRGRKVVTAGEIIRKCVKEDTMEAMLTGLCDSAFGRLENAKDAAEAAVKEHAPAYLRAHYPDLIETMLEQIRGERSDRSDDHD